MGKKLLLKIKINKHNKDNPGSSLNISEFIVCKDLMEHFDAATSKVIKVVKRTSSCIVEQHINQIAYKIHFLKFMHRLKLQQLLMLRSMMGNTPRRYPHQQRSLQAPSQLI